MEKVHIQEFAFDDPNIMPNLELSGYSYFDRLIAQCDLPAASQQGHTHQLFAQDTGENERCHDGGV
jgi:hypothetical protein